MPTLWDEIHPWHSSDGQEPETRKSRDLEVNKYPSSSKGMWQCSTRRHSAVLTEQRLVSHHQRSFLLQKMGTNRNRSWQCAEWETLEHQSWRGCLIKPSIGVQENWGRGDRIVGAEGKADTKETQQAEAQPHPLRLWPHAQSLHRSEEVDTALCVRQALSTTVSRFQRENQLSPARIHRPWNPHLRADPVPSSTRPMQKNSVVF